MSIREEIKSLLARENVTLQDIADKTGISIQNLSNKLRNQTIRYELVRHIVDLLGYDIKFEKRK